MTSEPHYATLALDEPAEHVLRVRLHRPESANALNTQMGLDLWDLWDRINAAPARHRCIILTGSGGRAFCAGGDLKERHGMTDEAWQAQRNCSPPPPRRSAKGSSGNI